MTLPYSPLANLSRPPRGSDPSLKFQEADKHSSCCY